MYAPVIHSNIRPNNRSSALTWMKYMYEIIVAYYSTKNITKCTPKYSIYIFSKNLWDDFGSEIFQKPKTILYFQSYKKRPAIFDKSLAPYFCKPSITSAISKLSAFAINSACFFCKSSL